MKYLFRPFSVLLILVLALLVAAIPRPVAASLPAPTSTLFPSSGPPGTVFFFSATGYESERVGYWFNAPDGTIYSNKYRFAAYAYENRFDWRWQVPYDAAPGMWTAVARGEESGIEIVIPFEVRHTGATGAVAMTPSASLPASTPGTTVAPQLGPPGTNFTFTAVGFNDDERVGYWFNAPDGTIRADTQNFWFQPVLDPARWSWKAPPDAKDGIWSVVARGEDSGMQHTIFFEVRHPPDVPPPGNAPFNPPCLAAVEPAVGHPNTEFAFFATGFPPRVQVRYWVEDPNGRNYGYDDIQTIGSNPDGRVDISWKAPDLATPGFWTIYFLSEPYGKEASSIERAIHFEVRRPGDPLPSSGEYTPPPPCQSGV